VPQDITFFMPFPFSSAALNDRAVPARGALPRSKQSLGRLLLHVCERWPALKPVLRHWGLRTWNQWQPDRVYHVSTPEGATFRLAGKNYLSFELFWKGTGYYEPVTTLVALALLRPGDTFLDVGANIGFYSLVLSTRQPGVAIVAFEPNPRNFRLLQNNARLNGFANLTCEPLALSDHEGTARLYPCKSDMSASLVPNFEETTGAPLEVRTTTLDAQIRRHPPRGRLVIKVDVEGHESAFFRGAAQTVARFRPDIIAEVALPYDGALTSFFRDHGYYFYPITDRGLYPADRLQPVIRGRFVFLNCLLSTRPPAEVAQLFHRIAPAVRRIDLRHTSKYLTPEAVARFTARMATAER